MERIYKSRAARLLFALALAAGAALRLEILFRAYPLSLSGDEAVVALMAKHIMELKEFPAYFWLAHYSGVFGAYPQALYFYFCGISAESFYLAGITFSLILTALVYKLGERMYGRVTGLIAAALISAASQYFIQFSYMIGGMYAESMFFTALSLLLFCMIIEPGRAPPRLFFPLGLSLGLGLWCSPYLIPVGAGMIVFLAARRRTGFTKNDYLKVSAGILLGCLPALIYNLQFPGGTALRMSGRVLNLDRSALALSSGDLVRVVAGQALHRLSLAPEMLLHIPRLILPVLGIEGRYMTGVLSKAAGFVTLLLYAAGVLSAAYRLKAVFARIKYKTPVPGDLLVIIVTCYIVFYCLFLEPRTPRYLLPIFIPLTLFLAEFLKDLADKVLPAALRRRQLC